MNLSNFTRISNVQSQILTSKKKHLRNAWDLYWLAEANKYYHQAYFRWAEPHNIRKLEHWQNVRLFVEARFFYFNSIIKSKLVRISTFGLEWGLVCYLQVQGRGISPLREKHIIWRIVGSVLKTLSVSVYKFEQDMFKS